MQPLMITFDLGSSPSAVKLNIYVKNYKPADAVLIGEALRGTFPHANLPASTWLGVETLAEAGFLIEVDAIAVSEE